MEKYLQDDPSEIKGFKEYQARLVKIAETLPGLSAAMKEKLADMDVYLVPKQISELPAGKTGLHFTTEQPFYQTRSEIFISEPGIAKMTADEVGDGLVHEAIMSLSAEKQSDQVRPVAARILSKVPTEKIQAALMKFKFGPYFTDEQITELVKRNTMKKFFDNKLFEAKELMACQGTAADEALYAKVQEEAQSGHWFGSTMNLSDQMVDEFKKGAGDIWISCGGAGRFFSGIEANPSPLCREVEEIYHDEDKLQLYKIPNLVNRYAGLKQGGAQYDRITNKLVVGFAETMGHSNAYLTAMALSPQPPKDKRQDDWNLKLMSRHPDRVEAYRKILAKIDQRRQQIDLSDKDSVYRLRCNSYKALAREIEKLAPAESVKEYGLDKKEGESGNLDDDQPVLPHQNGSAE